MPGLDGQKMSKSYGNTIALREEPESVAKKIRTMPTDPARVQAHRPGQPGEMPGVAAAPGLFRRRDQGSGCSKGCTSAGIGCLECKQPVIDAINEEQEPMRERAQAYLDDPTLVSNIIADGCENARSAWRRKPCAMCAKLWDYRTHERRPLNPSSSRDHARSPSSTASRSSSCRTTSTSRPTRSRSSSRPSRARSICCCT